MPETRPALPMPGEWMPHLRWTETVVASMWMDDMGVPVTALVLSLGPEPPFYRVRDLVWVGGTWRTSWVTDHPNIVPATAEYVARGGDY